MILLTDQTQVASGISLLYLSSWERIALSTISNKGSKTLAQDIAAAPCAFLIHDCTRTRRRLAILRSHGLFASLLVCYSTTNWFISADACIRRMLLLGEEGGSGPMRLMTRLWPILELDYNSCTCTLLLLSITAMRLYMIALS